MKKPKLILIGGPTASGKSKLALELAQQQQGVIINADAMQLYAGLPILTAQPSAEDLAEIPHLLYQFVQPNIRFSVGKWLDAVKTVIHNVIDLQKTPILVGGTGLYFRALLEGLAEIPEIPDEVLLKAQNLFDQNGLEGFRQLLAEHDPASASKLQDRQRLIRAYAVAVHTGHPLAYWQENKSGEKLVEAFAIDRHLIIPPRDQLYRNCDQRFLDMVEEGAILEAENLAKQKLDADLPAMKVIGVRELIAHLQGELSLAESVSKAQQATRNYAKRQVTWFKNQWAD